MTRFFKPDAEILAKSGHKGMAAIPVLFDAEFRLRRVHNRYLRERAMMEWHPVHHRGGKRPKSPISSRTVQQIARSLQHFGDWCDLTSRPWEALTYRDIKIYQEDQETGDAPNVKRRLSPLTSNMRADEATNFLVWAVHRKLRPQFRLRMTEVTRRFSHSSSMNPGTVVMKVRAGRSHEPRSRDFFSIDYVPDPAKIEVWLKAVNDVRGYAKHLICRFMVETGVRLMEAVAVEAEQWPAGADIAERIRTGHRTVPMKLLVTKGSVHRTIGIPVLIAEEIRVWIDGPRKKLSFLRAKASEGRIRPAALFLSDRKGFEGTPIQRHTAYDCFTDVAPRPVKWHPHMARHSYACHYMLDAVKRNAGPDIDRRDVRWLMGQGEFALQTLRHQLGHLDEETTQVYLKYLRTSLNIHEIADRYHGLLGNAEGEA